MTREGKFVPRGIINRHGDREDSGWDPVSLELHLIGLPFNDPRGYTRSPHFVGNVALGLRYTQNGLRSISDPIEPPIQDPIERQVIQKMLRANLSK